MSNISPEITEFIVPNLYGGLNLADSPSSLQPNECLKLQNLTFGDSNLLEIIQGYTSTATIATATANGGILGLHRYNDDDERYLLIAYNGSLYYTYGITADQTPITAASGLSSGVNYDFEQHHDFCFINNGSDEQRVYRHTEWRNDSKVRQSGLPPPIISDSTLATAVTTASSTASYDLPEGVYKFLFTLELNDGRIVEGEPNASAAAITVTGAGTAYGKIGFTATATGVDPEGNATWLNVYATDTDEDVYYYLTGMSLTGIVSAGAVATAGFEWTAYGDLTISEDNELRYDPIAGETLNNYRPPSGKVSRMWNGYHVVSCVTGQPTYAYFSKFGRYEQFPGNITASRSGGDPVSSRYVFDAQDDIVEIRVAKNGGLLFLCKNSIVLLTGYDPTTFQPTVLSRSVGCAAKKSVASDNDGTIFWVGWDDVYVSDGNNIQRIGRKIWPELKDLNETNFLKINGGFYKYCYYISYPDTNASSSCDRLLEYDARYNAWLGPHGQSNVRSGSTFTGTWLLKMGCFCTTRLEGKTIGFFGDATKGVVYQWDYGDSFDDDDNNYIFFKLHSGYLYQGAPFITKKYDSFGIELAPTYAQPSVYLVFDYTETSTFTLVTERSGDVYGTGVYGTAKYGNVSYEYIKRRLAAVEGTCMQFKIEGAGYDPSTNNAETNFSVRNIGMSFSISRRFRGK